MKGREGGSKFEGAGDRFGDYLCDDCTNLSCISGRNLQTQNSPDLTPKFQSLTVTERERVEEIGITAGKIELGALLGFIGLSGERLKGFLN